MKLGERSLPILTASSGSQHRTLWSMTLVTVISLAALLIATSQFLQSEFVSRGGTGLESVIVGGLALSEQGNGTSTSFDIPSLLGSVKVQFSTDKKTKSQPVVVGEDTSTSKIAASSPKDNVMSTTSANLPKPGFPQKNLVAYDQAYGRQSNHIHQLRNTLNIAYETGRAVLAHPMMGNGDLSDYGLPWMQLLDLNEINRLLKPDWDTSPLEPCLIKGWNVEPDEEVIRYITMNWTNGTPPQHREETCNELAAPHLLRDPNSWSASCLVRPFWHFNLTQFPKATCFECGFDGFLQSWETCDESVKVRPERRNAGMVELQGFQRPLGWSTNQSMYLEDTKEGFDDFWIFGGFNIFFFNKPEEPFTDRFADIPFTPWIQESARNSLDGLFQLTSDSSTKVLVEPPIPGITIDVDLKKYDHILCMHIRRTDLKHLYGNPPLPDLIALAEDYLSKGVVRQVLIVTDANEDERTEILSHIPGAKLGCDGEMTPHCANPMMAVAVEQQMCSFTGVFVGWLRSTVTQIIVRKREKYGKSSHIYPAIVRPRRRRRTALKS
eukprot:TRINITY_DN1504_c0_g1_i1.p1 TRINITY_DN1504_c0_g1~~TRINITY_DN1504_c0_g1_i1.p1  ORF type:complete len:552 (-),score=11.13 TRINITY_DN1504_c0_g1_i1:272-1927(-)